MLYPLKFRPRFVDKIWGGRKLEKVLSKPLPQQQTIGESWELYDFPPGVIDNSAQWVSVEIANGPLAGRTLHSVIEEFGPALHGSVRLLSTGQFPVLIKFLDARENLSIQVHCDVAYVEKHPECHVKNEAWYVVQADPGAKIYRGLKPGVTREQFAGAINSGRLEEHIKSVDVRAGQCYYLPSGTIHALGAGTLVAEVQTPSDTTFRVYDFDRMDPTTGQKRKLHIREALECICFDNRPETPQPRSHVAGLFTTVTKLVSSPYFTIEKVRFTEGVEEPVPYDQPVVWMMLEGEAQLRTRDLRDPVNITRGETVLLPSRMNHPTIKTQSDCVWLEVTFPSPGPT